MFSARTLRTLVLSGCLLAVAVVARTVAADEAVPEIFPFEAVYEVRAFGIGRGESVLRLTTTEQQGVYEFSAVGEPRGLTRLFVDREWECSRFRVEEDQLRPLRYHNSDKEDSQTIRFDRGDQKVLAAYKGREVELPLEPGTLDPATEQVAALLDLRRAAVSIGPYRTIDRNEYRDIEYRPEGTAEIETPAGTYQTVAFRRQRVGSSRSVLIWYAPKLNWIPVQMQHFKRDKQQGLAQLTRYEHGRDEDQARGNVTPLCP